MKMKLLKLLPLLLAASYLPAGQPRPVRGIGILFDGDGSALVPGKTLYYAVPFGCTIQGWDMTVDFGTASIDAWKVPNGSVTPTSANSITGGNTPAITNGQHVYSNNLAGWSTTSVAAHDVFGFYLKSVLSATEASLVLQCQ